MATLDRTINADADDGGSNESGDWNDDFDTTLLGDPFGEGEHTWLRFPNITIPQGATITVAYVTFQTDDSGLFDAGTIRSNIYGIDEDDHAAPTSDGTWATDHSAHTAASTVWDFSAQDSGSLQTPSIVSIIQEIVDRAGWSSGNDIGIHIDDDGTSGAAQELAANEHSSLSAASLHVEYTAGTNHQETAATSITVSGAAEGRAVHRGTAASSVSVSGSATAHAVRKATATASISVTATATGKSQPQKATAAASISVTTTATGRAVHRATATTTITVSASATGSRPARQSTGTANVTVTCTASGKKVARQTASCQITVTTAALAWRPRAHLTGVSTIAGKPSPAGAAGAPDETDLDETQARGSVEGSTGVAATSGVPPLAGNE